MTLEAEYAPARRAELGIGGSDAPIIAGVSPYKAPVELWAERVGLVERDQRQNPAMTWGRDLEGMVLRAYARETGFRVVKPAPGNRYLSITHPTIPWMYGHLDGIVRKPVRDARVVEAKTARTDRGWGDEDNGRAIPEMHYPQVQHYLAVTGYPVADVPVLIAGSDFRTYTVPRDDDYIAGLIELEEEFMAAVRERREPELDGSDSTRRYLAARYANATAEEKVATPEQEALVAELALRVAAVEAAELSAEEARARVKAILGTASVLWTPEWKVTWKEVARKAPVDWEAFAANLSRVLGQINGLVTGETLDPETIATVRQLTDPGLLAVARNLVTGEPSSYRRFVLTEGGSR